MCYTPAHIVDYVVENTVGRRLQDQTPQQLVGNLHILDPACGVGAFLIGAYHYLLGWYRNWYGTHEPEQYLRIGSWGYAPLDIGEDGCWQLAIAEKKRILLNHLYGVDIDQQAVAATRRSLVQALLTEEPGTAANSRFCNDLLAELGQNIRWGNAIIGPDFPEQCSGTPGQIPLLAWEATFQPVMSRGGFNIVIGNPPYLDSEQMTDRFPEWRRYCRQHYRTASGNWDLFCVFIEQALNLCQPRGLVGFVVPNKLGSAPYAAMARQLLAVENCLLSIRDYSGVASSFPTGVYPIVYIAQKRRPCQANPVRYTQMQVSGDGTFVCAQQQNLDYGHYFLAPQRSWPLRTCPAGVELVERLLRQSPTLAALASVSGAATVAEAYKIQPLIQETCSADFRGLKVINSGTIDRYRILWGQQPLRYLGSTYHRPGVPESRLSALPPRRRRQTQQPKLIVAGMTRILESVLDRQGVFLAGKSTSVIASALDLRYLLALLNSKLLTFCYQTLFGGDRLRGGYLRIGPPQLRQLPICVCDLGNSIQRRNYEQLIALVEQRRQSSQLVKNHPVQLHSSKASNQLDQSIDQLVYALYGLTEAEIQLVEGGVEFFPGNFQA